MINEHLINAIFSLFNVVQGKYGFLSFVSYASVLRAEIGGLQAPPFTQSCSPARHPDQSILVGSGL